MTSRAPLGSTTVLLDGKTVESLGIWWTHEAYHRPNGVNTKFDCSFAAETGRESPESEEMKSSTAEMKISET